mmetsp:Transcript_18501/g.26130  ORF Transcript_18501/g.26130 Transcript_18501/m.26130 type:complete len:114 (+) Transcript_18501:108-449(+)
MICRFRNFHDEVMLNYFFLPHSPSSVSHSQRSNAVQSPSTSMSSQSIASQSPASSSDESGSGDHSQPSSKPVQAVSSTAYLQQAIDAGMHIPPASQNLQSKLAEHASELPESE